MQALGLPLLETVLPQQASSQRGRLPVRQFLPVSADVLCQFPKLQARVLVQPELVTEWCRPKAMERRVLGKA